MKQLILVFMLIPFQLILFGQEKQKLVLEIFPPESFLKIDDQVIDVNKKKSPFTLEMNPGTYPIQIWSEKYSLYEDTIVVGNKTTFFTKGLIVQSTAFKDFKNEMKTYKRAKNTRSLKAAGIIIANLAGLYIAIDGTTGPKLKDLERRANVIRGNHNNTATDTQLAANRASYEMIQSDYDSMKKKLYLRRSIGIPVVALTSVFSARYIKKMWSKKLIKPIFNGDKNPFVLKSIEVDPSDSSCNVNFKFEF